MRKITLISIILILVLLPGFLFGQESSAKNRVKNQKQIQISSGYYHLGSIDEIYSNNIYSGGNICYGLKYSFGKTPALQSTTLRYAMINRYPNQIIASDTYFTDGSRERVLQSFIFEAIYSYQYPIQLHEGSKFRLFVTGDWITTINITNNAEGVPELVRSGISPGARLDYNLKHHSFSGRFSIPFISWTVRNNYSQSMAQTYESLDKMAFVKQNSQLQFPNTFLEIATEWSYNYDLSKHFRVGCEYDFRYLYNSSPRKLYSVTGIYTAGVTYKF
jgi:hypothetical protein